MYKRLFAEFINSGDSFRVYEGSRLIFSSTGARLMPLLEYLDTCSERGSVAFDKIVGNAAALLFVKAGLREVYSPLGSREAIRTLERYAIKYRFTSVTPLIQLPDGKPCPMEQLSLNKEPGEFYRAIKGAMGALSRKLDSNSAPRK